MISEFLKKKTIATAAAGASAATASAAATAGPPPRPKLKKRVGWRWLEKSPEKFERPERLWKWRI